MSKAPSQWIELEEGRYLAERAFLVTANDTHAVTLGDTVIEVYTIKSGARYLKGYATVANSLLVDLMEEDDTIDLILDFGAAFKYRLHDPQIRSGKVFAPDVHATLQFFPSVPWQEIPEDQFEHYLSNLQFI